ncbi:MAG: extracellular solute-binding protein [Candidatus Omnitrophota bacterium]|jgi:ABC-type glycerol-3-phosphate transport system substrate-binding protein
MKKIMVLILTGFLFISGCGQNNTKAVSGKGGIEISMWLIGSEGQALTMRDLADEFYKESGIRVKCDAISWGDAHSKYLTSIAGGVAPDIGTMGLTWGTEFGRFGAIVDLNQAYPEEVKAIKESVFTGLWNSIDHQGKVYGIPFDLSEYVMYYRSDMIPNPPTTWEELTALLATLNKSGKGMIFDWGSLSWIGYSSFLWQAGGDYYNKDYTSSTVATPEAVKAMIFFSDLYTKYNVPKTKIPLEQGLRTGDFPIAISGNWKLDDLRLSAPEIAGKWAIATLPKGPTGKSTAFIGGRVIAIFEQSKNKEAAWKFIKFFYRPETQLKLYKSAQMKQDTYLPPSKKTWDMLDMDKKFKEVLVKQADDSKGPPSVANWDSTAKYIDDAIQKIVLQNADVKKELEFAKEQLEKALKQK